MTKVNEMIFVGLKARVAALDKYTGKRIWSWQSKHGFSGYVALLLEAERLYVSVDGYTTCLDALTGKERWHNPLKGMGVGVPCMALSTGHSQALLPMAEDTRRRQSTSTVSS
jgi:outer membrane protein assembly factor BamB